METRSKNNSDHGTYGLKAVGAKEMVRAFEKAALVKDLFQENSQIHPDEHWAKLVKPEGKKSFLVFAHNKYILVPTGSIAFFYVKYGSSIIVNYDRQQYSVTYSLDQLEHLLPDDQFYRLNRQCLINFAAIKEVEHYFARKLLVKLTVPAPELLLVSKEKASSFLHWLEDR